MATLGVQLLLDLIRKNPQQTQIVIEPKLMVSNHCAAGKKLATFVALKGPGMAKFSLWRALPNPSSA
jgi:hypothetical protein